MGLSIPEPVESLGGIFRSRLIIMAQLQLGGWRCAYEPILLYRSWPRTLIFLMARARHHSSLLLEQGEGLEQLNSATSIPPSLMAFVEIERGNTCTFMGGPHTTTFSTIRHCI